MTSINVLVTSFAVSFSFSKGLKYIWETRMLIINYIILKNYHSFIVIMGP